MKRFSKKDIKVSFKKRGEVQVTVSVDDKLTDKEVQKILSNVWQRYDIEKLPIKINGTEINHKKGKLQSG